VPTVTFNLDDVLYMELVKRGKSIGLSPHQVAKEIVVSHLLNHSSDINIPHKYPNYTSDINIGNKYPIYRSDTYVEHKYPTYISDINIANKAGQDPDNDKLLEKLEAFDKRLRRLEDLINAYTGKSDQVLQRLSQLVESQEKVAELLQQVAEFLRQGSAKVSEERQRVSGESERKAKREKVDACERRGLTENTQEGCRSPSQLPSLRKAKAMQAQCKNAPVTA